MAVLICFEERDDFNFSCVPEFKIMREREEKMFLYVIFSHLDNDPGY